MPVWHEKTKPLRDGGELEVVGIVQEQHAERAKLYAQWKGFDWPILQDQMTSLGLAVVPVFVLLDENGVVLENRLRPNQFEKLLSKQPVSTSPKIEAKRKKTDCESYVASGDAKLMQRQPNKAIKLYERALTFASNDEVDLVPLIEFRLGVAYRARYDSKNGANPNDFSNASSYWTRAREGNPNQYIWRRRIEQYGPRNIKPYPFYDWVDDAVKEIRARGEQPVELNVRLAGAEIALPAKRSAQSDPIAAAENPDRESKITLVDSAQPEIKASITTVPSKIAPGQTVRVHVQFQPGNGMKWNNESTRLQVWIEGIEGQVSKQLFSVTPPSTATSTETRGIEFEYTANKNSAEFGIAGFVLANVCPDAEGVCLFRRCNLEFDITKK